VARKCLAYEEMLYRLVAQGQQAGVSYIAHQALIIREWNVNESGQRYV
jgi:hypothetical protein